MAGLYIHIPFCTQACSYCDFYFLTGSRGREAREPFMHALFREVEAAASFWPLAVRAPGEGERLSGAPPSKSYSAPNPSPLAGHTETTPEPLRTIYIGGGTPSLIPSHQLHTLLEKIQRLFPSQLREVTLEVNPENVTREVLKEWKKAGITRLSIGIQSFSSDLLEFMHRAHDSKTAMKALEWVAEAGFTSWSTDLIYGNPDQDLQRLENDLNIFSRFDPPHISAYSLTVEQRTRLDVQVRAGKIKLPESEEVARQMAFIQSFLGERGYERYEVSSYAKFGHRSVHNHAYWTHEPYLGLGPAAHSFMWSPQHKSGWRWSHPRDLHAYLRLFSGDATGEAMDNAEEPIPKTHQSIFPGSGPGSPYPDPKSFETFEELDLHSLAEERVMLGLRTSDGVRRSELDLRYGFQFTPAQEALIAKRVDEGMMLDGEAIILTPEGLSIADYLTTDLLAEG